VLARVYVHRVGATLGTYLEFYFTDRRDGWELRGRRVEINFNETREARGKFFRLARPREPQRKSQFLPTYVCGETCSSLSLARTKISANSTAETKEVLLQTRLAILKKLFNPVSLTCNGTALRAISRKIATARRDFVYLIDNAVRKCRNKRETLAESHSWWT